MDLLSGIVFVMICFISGSMSALRKHYEYSIGVSHLKKNCLRFFLAQNNSLLQVYRREWLYFDNELYSNR